MEWLLLHHALALMENISLAALSCVNHAMVNVPLVKIIYNVKPVHRVMLLFIRILDVYARKGFTMSLL
jgi:hypothetical protein